MSSRLEQKNRSLSKGQLSGENCPICQEEENGKSIIQLFCNHWYHSECLKRTLETNRRGRSPVCDLCKKRIIALESDSESEPEYQPEYEEYEREYMPEAQVPYVKEILISR